MGKSQLHSAIKECNWSAAEAALRKTPSSATKKEDGQLALHFGLKMKAPINLIDSLLESYPVSVRIRNGDGQTPFLTACMYGSDVDVLELIVAVGLRIQEDVTKAKVEKKGAHLRWTALHFMANFHKSESDDDSVAKYLIEKMPESLDSEDAVAKLPIHYATDPVVRKALFIANPCQSVLDEALLNSVIDELTPSLMNGKGLQDKRLLRAWSSICSHKNPENFLPTIDDLFNKFPDAVPSLTKTKNSEGKSPMELASRPVLRLMTQHVLFCGRYVLGDVIHRGVNNILVVAKDLQASGDYRAIFRAFVQMEKEQKESEKSRSEKNMEHAEAGVSPREEAQDGPAGRSNDGTTTTTGSDIKDGSSQSFLSKNSAHRAVNLLGFGISSDTFNAAYKKWTHNLDHSIDEASFIQFCKADLDKNKPRTVVIKFMKDKEKFLNEITPRFEKNLESSYVMSVLKKFDSTAGEDEEGEGDILFRKDVQKQKSILDPLVHNLAFVMAKGDSNLDTIYRQEKPSISSSRVLMREVGLCLKHLHSKSVVHGDLKMLNVVRFNNRLRLVDMDSAIMLGDDRDVQYFGVPNSFSTGLVPPECVFKLESKEQLDQLDAYWAGYNGKEGTNLGPEKAGRYGEKLYCLKTCNDERIMANDESAKPPYELLPASVSFDLWAFACQVYNITVGFPLFSVNCDDQLCPGAIEQLADFDDAEKERKILQNVSDPICQDLLMTMLSRDPAERFQTIEEVLDHPFFAVGDDVANEYVVKMLKRDMQGARSKLDKLQKVEKALRQGKNFKLNRVSTRWQSALDKSVSTVCHDLFESDFKVPKSFVVVPEKESGTIVWLTALEHITNLIKSEGEGKEGGGDKDDNDDDNDDNDDNDNDGEAVYSSGSRRMLSPSGSTASFTSIKNELLSALQYYGETRFNLLWIDECTGLARRNPEHRTINMSFLNALRFAPLMIFGLRVMGPTFGSGKIAACFGVEAASLPEFLAVPAGRTQNTDESGTTFETLDVIYEFDMFQKIIDKYGRFLDDEVGDSSAAGPREGIPGEGSKEGSLNRRLFAESATPGEENDAIAMNGDDGRGTTPTSKLLEKSRYSWKSNSRSPVKLSRHSHEKQLADFETFVLARDADFVLGGLVRVVGAGDDCGLWTAREEADKIVQESGTLRTEEDAALFASLKGSIESLRDKERRLALAEEELKALTETNSIQASQIISLEERMAMQLAEKEAEFNAKTGKLLSHLESTATEKNEALQKLQEEMNVAKLRHEDELRKATNERDDLQGSHDEKHEALLSEKKRLEEEFNEAHKMLRKSDSFAQDLERLHDELGNEKEELLVQVKMKDNAMEVLKAKNNELELEKVQLNNMIVQMRSHEKEYEVLKATLSKRDQQLANKMREGNKMMAKLDRKDAEIARLSRQLGILRNNGSGGGQGGTSGGLDESNKRILEMNEKVNKLEIQNKGHVRELKLLRGIAKERVNAAKILADESDSVISSASKKLRDMEEEMRKIKMVVNEGEKFGAFLKGLKPEVAIGAVVGNGESCARPRVPSILKGSPASSPSFAPGVEGSASGSADRRVSFSSNLSSVSMIDAGGGSVKGGAISTPTKPRQKVGATFADYRMNEGEESSEEEEDSDSVRYDRNDGGDTGGASDVKPMPPTKESVVEHKRRVRALLFGNRVSSGLEFD